MLGKCDKDMFSEYTNKQNKISSNKHQLRGGKNPSKYECLNSVQTQRAAIKILQESKIFKIMENILQIFLVSFVYCFQKLLQRTR